MLAFSNCKINIGLDIVAKRPDGYHDIVTAMVPIPWHDVIEIVPAERTELVTYGRKVDCPPEKNLVMKAYREMEARFDLPPVKICLEKIIPDGAGLGGGSGDATTTLMLLNDMFDLGQSVEEIAQIASGIGADCPFFAYGRPMLGTGTGTTLQPIDLDLSGFYILIAKPKGVAISTKQAYAGVTLRVPAESLEQLLRLPVDQWQGRVKNDFEPSIFAIAPQVRALKERMLQGGAVYAAMSGSGSAVFGIFSEDPKLDLPDTEITAGFRL